MITDKQFEELHENILVKLSSLEQTKQLILLKNNKNDIIICKPSIE